MYTRSNQVINGVRLIGFAHGDFYFVEDQSETCAMYIDEKLSLSSCKHISDTDTFEVLFTHQEVTWLSHSLIDYLHVLKLPATCNQFSKLVIIDCYPRYSGVCLETLTIVPLSPKHSSYTWVEIARSKISVKDYYDTYTCKSNSSR